MDKNNNAICLETANTHCVYIDDLKKLGSNMADMIEFFSTFENTPESGDYMSTQVKIDHPTINLTFDGKKAINVLIDLYLKDLEKHIQSKSIQTIDNKDNEDNTDNKDKEMETKSEIIDFGDDLKNHILSLSWHNLYEVWSVFDYWGADFFLAQLRLVIYEKRRNGQAAFELSPSDFICVYLLDSVIEKPHIGKLFATPISLTAWSKHRFFSQTDKISEAHQQKEADYCLDKATGVNKRSDEIENIDIEINVDIEKKRLEKLKRELIESKIKWGLNTVSQLGVLDAWFTEQKKHSFFLCPRLSEKVSPPPFPYEKKKEQQQELFIKELNQKLKNVRSVQKNLYILDGYGDFCINHGASMLPTIDVLLKRLVVNSCNLFSIDDLCDLLCEGVYIAGGSVSACLVNETMGPDRDIDIFVIDLNHLARTIQKCVNLAIKQGRRVWGVFRTSVITLAIEELGRHIQIIASPDGTSLEDLLSEFDMDHLKCAVGVLSEKTIKHQPDIDQLDTEANTITNASTKTKINANNSTNTIDTKVSDLDCKNKIDDSNKNIDNNIKINVSNINLWALPTGLISTYTRTSKSTKSTYRNFLRAHRVKERGTYKIAPFTADWVLESSPHKHENINKSTHNANNDDNNVGQNNFKRKRLDEVKSDIEKMRNKYYFPKTFETKEQVEFLLKQTFSIGDNVTHVIDLTACSHQIEFKNIILTDIPASVSTTASTSASASASTSTLMSIPVSTSVSDSVCVSTSVPDSDPAFISTEGKNGDTHPSILDLVSKLKHGGMMHKKNKINNNIFGHYIVSKDDFSLISVEDTVFAIRSPLPLDICCEMTKDVAFMEANLFRGPIRPDKSILFKEPLYLNFIATLKLKKIYGSHGPYGSLDQKCDKLVANVLEHQQILMNIYENVINYAKKCGLTDANVVPLFKNTNTMDSLWVTDSTTISGIPGKGVLALPLLKWDAESIEFSNLCAENRCVRLETRWSKISYYYGQIFRHIHIQHIEILPIYLS